MRLNTRFLGTCVCLGVLIACSAARPTEVTSPVNTGKDLNITPVKKKLIATGWEFSKQTLEDLPGITKALNDGPFDGVVLQFDVRGDQKELCTTSTVTGGQVWKKVWFNQDVQTLKATSSKRLTDNFLIAWISPNYKAPGVTSLRMAWSDNKRWHAFANNMAVLAWVAKQGALKGLTLDPEDYGTSGQYEYQPSDGDYDTTARLARSRGAQVMAAMSAEYPDITLLSYWLLSIKPNLFMNSNPALALKQSGDLWTPFVNGMLDALPPKARLIDGMESAYRFKDTDFPVYAAQLHGNALNLVAPENRAKYRTQVQTSFGIYMDAHLNPAESPWYQPPLNGSRLNRLCNNVATALSTADEYVWLYGEQGTWSDWKPKSGASLNQYKMWDEKMPGVIPALEFAKDPDVQARKEVEALRSKNELKNIAKNASFEKESKPATPNSPLTPLYWSTWQADNSKGTFSLDTSLGFGSISSAKMLGVSNGCFIQAYTVKPGESYAVECASLIKGAGYHSICIRWQDSSEKWTQMSKDRDIYFTGAQTDWQKAFGSVTVPDGAERLVLLLSAHQPTSTDACWYDKVGVYKLR